MDRNEWEQAINLLEQARQEEPESPYVLGSLAFCHSRLRQHAQAIALYEKLCQLEPEAARWPYSLGYQYYDQQQYPRAIEYFDRALEIEPDYIVVLYRKGYALSTIKGKEGHSLTTFEHCRKAYHALPDGDVRDREQKNYANACYQQGKLFLKLHNYRLAEERLREAAKLKPEEHDVHYSLGRAYVETSRYKEAIDCLTTAQRLSKQPQHYILDFLARAYAGAGRLQEAIAVYEQMPASIRSRSYVLRNMGDVYAQLEQWDKAERTLQEAVKREHRNHNGHYRLGVVYQHLGKGAEAAREFRVASELRQKNYGKPFPEAEQALVSLLAEHPEIAGAVAPKRTKPPVSASGRPVARIKVYFEDRGYGFLEIGNNEGDLFFHITEVEGRDSVQTGECVEYNIGERKGKRQAVDLYVLTSQP
jgi:tetratricopeptide (TPR) repeat protein